MARNVTISPTAHTGNPGDIFSLECSVNTESQANFPVPSFEWYFGPNDTSLPSSLTVSSTMTSDNTHSSTLTFFPLQEFHTGTYTCQIGDNESQAASAVIHVNPSKTSINKF